MGKHGPAPLGKISKEWTPKLAYAVGLIATNGCLSKDGRHIDFTSQDIQLINLFKICLGLRHIKTGFKLGSFSGKPCPRVQFGDINFYQWLQKLGLTPRKSRTISSIKIPNKFFFDFLRGCFDGDGTIYSFFDKRWRNSFMFYIAFASGSKRFLLWLQEKLSESLNINGHITYGMRNTFQLKYAKEESIVLFRAMFYKANLPCMKRKFLKAHRIFKKHDGIVERNKLARVVKFSKHATLRGWCP